MAPYFALSEGERLGWRGRLAVAWGYLSERDGYGTSPSPRAEGLDGGDAWRWRGASLGERWVRCFVLSEGAGAYAVVLRSEFRSILR